MVSNVSSCPKFMFLISICLVDYNDTYASVVSLDTLRIFIAIVTQFDLECDKIDVITAFLYGNL